MRPLQSCGLVRDYRWEFSDSRYNRGVMSRLPSTWYPRRRPSPTAGSLSTNRDCKYYFLELSAYTKLSIEGRRIFGANFKGLYVAELPHTGNLHYRSYLTVRYIQSKHERSRNEKGRELGTPPNLHPLPVEPARSVLQ
jgi:hypothetical protein